MGKILLAICVVNRLCYETGWYGFFGLFRMKSKTISRKGKIWLIVAGSLLLLILVLHLLLPPLLLKYVNRQLATLEGYKGSVRDIDIALFRGAYKIKDIRLDKVNGKIPHPFFAADVIDFSVQWGALFRGKIVAEIEVDKPVLNFVNGPSKATSQTGVDKDWTEVVDKLIPIKLNRFEIHNGIVHYRDLHSAPKVNIYASDIFIIAENLSNARRNDEQLPSTVTAGASVYGGNVKLDMKLDALNRVPTFDVNARLSKIDLVKLNDFLRAYGNFDVEKGTLELYTEAAAKNGLINGYTKPIIKDLKVLNWKEDTDNPAEFLWESIVGAAAWVLTNKKKDQVATKAEFQGRIDDPNANIWFIISQLLRNAFIEALYPSLENSVNINNLRGKEEKPTLLEKIFKKDKKKKKGDKKN